MSARSQEWLTGHFGQTDGSSHLAWIRDGTCRLRWPQVHHADLRHAVCRWDEELRHVHRDSSHSCRRVMAAQPEGAAVEGTINTRPGFVPHIKYRRLRKRSCAALSQKVTPFPPVLLIKPGGPLRAGGKLMAHLKRLPVDGMEVVQRRPLAGEKPNICGRMKSCRRRRDVNSFLHPALEQQNLYTYKLSLKVNFL